MKDSPHLALQPPADEGKTAKMTTDEIFAGASSSSIDGESRGVSLGRPVPPPPPPPRDAIPHDDGSEGILSLRPSGEPESDASLLSLRSSIARQNSSAVRRSARPSSSQNLGPLPLSRQPQTGGSVEFERVSIDLEVGDGMHASSSVDGVPTNPTAARSGQWPRWPLMTCRMQ